MVARPRGSADLLQQFRRCRNPAPSAHGLERLRRIPAESPAWQNDRSACSRLQGSCAFIVPSFMVLLRGSNTARMRWPTCRRRPSMVVRMAVVVVGEVVVDGDAVGDAQHFHAPLDVAEFAQRARRHGRGHAHVLRGRDGRQALSWLCTPPTSHCTRVTRWPCSSTSKRVGSPSARKSLTAAPKLRTSLQQPWCSTRRGFPPGRSPRSGRWTGWCARDGGTAARSRPGRRRCPRDRTPGCSGWPCAAGSG